MKLPPGLTIPLKRHMKDENMYHKNEAHVSYKHHLGVGQFMDSGCLSFFTTLFNMSKQFYQEFHSLLLLAAECTHGIGQCVVYRCL